LQILKKSQVLLIERKRERWPHLETRP
jgi:hypothetical protein